MSRPLTAVTREDLEQASAKYSLPVFVKINHPNLDRTINIVSDAVDYEFEGVLWNKGGFDLTLLSDNDSAPKTKFSFDNIDRDADRMFRTMRGTAEVSFRIFSSSNFDASTQPRQLLSGVTPIAEYQALHLELINVTVTPEIISGTLINFDLKLFRWPSRRVTEDIAPGVFLK